MMNKEQATKQTLQFFKIFLQLLNQRAHEEMVQQQKVTEDVLKLDEQAILSLLTRIEKSPQVQSNLEKQYSRYLQDGGHRSRLAFYRGIAADRKVHHIQFEQNTAKIYPQFKQGACTAIPMSVLMTVQNNPLQPLLSENKQVQVDPKALMLLLKAKGYDAYLYETSKERNFKAIFDKYAVQTGAFIVIDLDKPVQSDTIGRLPDFKELTRGHTLVYTGQDQTTGEPLYISFDNNKHNDILRPRWQCGFVIDFPKIVRQEYLKQR